MLAEHWPRLVAMACLLGASAIFSGSETAFFSLSRREQRRLRREGTGLDALLARLLASPRRLLISVLLGNLAVNIAYFSLAADLTLRVAESGRNALAVGISATSFLCLIFLAEFIPKGVALQRPTGFARVTATPVFLFAQAILPLRFLLEIVVGVVSRLMGGRTSAVPVATADELKAFVRLSGTSGRIGAVEQDMLEDVIELGEMKLREVMVPRVDMVASDVSAGRQGVLELARERRVSKVVIYEGSRDEVVGFVAVKDLLYSPDAELSRVIRDIPAYPETKSVESLLRELRARRAALALVVDEYGGTEGIVAPEDVLEVVVGEIGDEYDPLEDLIRAEGPGHLLVAGEATLREWEERTGVPIPPGKYETVAGYVLATLDRMPAPGDSVTGAGYEFMVVRVRGGRVVSLVAERKVAP